MWSSSARQINYGLPSEMGMVGLRDVFLVAPASFHHTSNQHQEATINFDPHTINVSNALGVGVGVGVNVIPLLTSVGVDDNALNTSRTRGGAVHLWQNQQSQMKKPAILDHSGGSNLLQGGNGCGIGSSASTNTTTTTCQDCGNQAKKDCSHRRCRTCCKSRGYDCSTHVKSTWVPASRRRERQLMAAAATAAAAGSSQSISSAKKPKLAASQTTTASHTSTSNNTPPISFDTGSSHQDAGFKDLPGQVRAPAVFKCVRVTSIDDGEDEYAYQAVVKIGGHVFKGFLYDQGVEERDGFPNISDLHLGAGGGNNGGGRNGASSSSPILDPSDVYAISSGGFLGGSSTYGNPIN